MNYYLPTKIIYGKNAVEESKNDLVQIGSKALIVTGRNSARLSGALAQITQLLKSINIEYSLYSEIEENPTLLSVQKGVEITRSQDCDFIIGIGGGSPIDAAKAIALLVGSNLAIEDIYNSAKFTKALPIVAVPITSGTGTEATQYSVLTDTINHKKAGFGSPLVFPTLSIMNPEFTISLPKSVTLNTAIDALSHLLEGIYSKNRNELVYPMLFEGVKLIIENLPKTLKSPTDYSSRDALMRASMFGGIVIAHSGTTLQHSIGYPLTTKFNTPHGLANGIVMQDIMELYYPHIKEPLDSLFSYLNMTKDSFYKWLEQFNLTLDNDLNSELIDYMTTKVMATRNMALNPLLVTEDDVKKLYRNL